MTCEFVKLELSKRSRGFRGVPKMLGARVGVCISSACDSVLEGGGTTLWVVLNTVRGSAGDSVFRDRLRLQYITSKITRNI